MINKKISYSIKAYSSLPYLNPPTSTPRPPIYFLLVNNLTAHIWQMEHGMCPDKLKEMKYKHRVSYKCSAKFRNYTQVQILSIRQAVRQ